MILFAAHYKIALTQESSFRNPEAAHKKRALFFFLCTFVNVCGTLLPYNGRLGMISVNYLHFCVWSSL